MKSKSHSNLNRREFTKQFLSGVAGSFALISPWSAVWANALAAAKSKSPDAPSDDLYLIAGHRTGISYEESTHKHFLTVGRLSDRLTKIIPVKTDVHSIVKNAANSNVILTISKNQSRCTYFPNVLDFKNQKIIHAGAKQIFSGHAVYSADGKILITSETNEAKDLGVLVIRDGKTLKVIDRMDSGGQFPHEIKFLDAETIAVANGGGPSLNGANLSVIDLKHKKVIETHVPPQFGPGVRHFVVDQSGNFVVGTWVTYGSLDESKPPAQMLSSKISQPGAIKALEFSEQHKSMFRRRPTQFLSVAFHSPSGQAVLTATGADVVVVVDSVNGKINKVLKKANPCGVSACGNEQLMAVTDATGHVQFLDMKTLDWRPDLQWMESSLTGSHMELIKIG